MIQTGPVSVLVAPLDWGLGHATRCIPIINELINQGARVTIAATGSQKALLQQEFPGLSFLDIPGYNIGYKRGFLLKWGLFFRIPIILRQIRRENQWLKSSVKQHSFDAVISDNRFGLYHEKVYTVFLTHQLFIRSGLKSLGKEGSLLPESDGRKNRGRLQGKTSRWAERKLFKWNYSFISNFSCCWVPDQQGSFSAAGKLSNPPWLPPVPVKYIGILSRFFRLADRSGSNVLLILLSGPEPQRTEFENIIFSQLKDSDRKAVVVRGLPSTGAIPFIRENVKIYNHLPTAELNVLLNEAGFIVARSGYSTIMDLLKLKKNAILVPTPGQPEQEYLGYYMNEKKWMFYITERNFNLEKALNMFPKQEMTLPELKDSTLKEVVQEFLTEVLETKKENTGFKL